MSTKKRQKLPKNKLRCYVCHEVKWSSNFYNKLTKKYYHRCNDCFAKMVAEKNENCTEEEWQKNKRKYNNKKCDQCKKTLPRTEFLHSGKRDYAICKSCRKENRKSVSVQAPRTPKNQKIYDVVQRGKKLAGEVQTTYICICDNNPTACRANIHTPTH